MTIRPPCVGGVINTSKNDAPEHVTTNYDLVFEDTFETGIDPAKWRTAFLWGADLTINQEQQYYVDIQDPNNTHPSPFSINADGNLSITATPITGTKPITNQGRTNGQDFYSGIITTRESMSFQYGYAEVCCKMPGTYTDGAWPANWLLNTNYYQNAFLKNQAENGGVGNDKFNPEIDFTEQVHGPNYQGALCSKNAYHYFTGDRESTTNYILWTQDGGGFRDFNIRTGQVGTIFNQSADCDGNPQSVIPDDCGADFSQDFHTYGVDWTPDYIHYYRDGMIVNCINSPSLVSDQLMYLLINFAVGGSFPFGNPATQEANVADYPASMEVEYARIYKL